VSVGKQRVAAARGCAVSLGRRARWWAVGAGLEACCWGCLAAWARCGRDLGGQGRPAGALSGNDLLGGGGNWSQGRSGGGVERGRTRQARGGAIGAAV
jgi:hypothetical protein